MIDLQKQQGEQIMDMIGIGALGPIMADEDHSGAEKQRQAEGVTSTKVEIPQCAIDVIENAKEQEYSLSKAMDIMGKTMEFCHWIDLPTNQELFARAWLDGYEEARYLVKMKNLNAIFCYLAYDKSNKYWSLANHETDQIAILHTRKELEEAGFGEVFTSSLFEVSYNVKQEKYTL